MARPKAINSVSVNEVVMLVIVLVARFARRARGCMKIKQGNYPQEVCPFW